MKRNIIIGIMLFGFTLTAAAQKYHVKSITKERILIDDRYAQDNSAMEYLAPYKAKVDSVMSPIVGKTAKYMKAYTPESELTNLLADIMVWCGKKYNEKVDIGIYNVGGIRAALPKGTITFGDVNDMAPFENKIYFLTLNGTQLLKLFSQIAKHHGAGISHGVCVTLKNNEVVSLTLNGEPVDPQKNYRIATLDYLAKGNDGFRELMNGSNVNAPQENEANTRYLIAEYFREKNAAGEIIDSNVEGRVVILK